jgi:gluconate 5-dehydrogenase
MCMFNNDLFSLTDKVAIITGGSQGIGFGIAKAFGELKAKVVIVNRNPDQGMKAVDDIQRSGGYAISIPTDVVDLKSVGKMVQMVIDKFNKIDILVNNAAVNIRKPAEQMDETEFNYIIGINLKGVFICTQEVGRQMIKQKRGKIINISSTGANRALENLAVYCASKGGVSQLTKVFAYEWGKYNITVNAIGPGSVPTAMSDPERFKKFLERIPLGRLGTPQDIAGLAIVLASDASNYITGQTIYVDGGWTIF